MPRALGPRQPPGDLGADLDTLPAPEGLPQPPCPQPGPLAVQNGERHSQEELASLSQDPRSHLQELDGDPIKRRHLRRAHTSPWLLPVSPEPPAPRLPRSSPLKTLQEVGLRSRCAEDTKGAGHNTGTAGEQQGMPGAVSMEQVGDSPRPAEHCLPLHSCLPCHSSTTTSVQLRACPTGHLRGPGPPPAHPKVDGQEPVQQAHLLPSPLGPPSPEMAVTRKPALHGAQDLLLPVYKGPWEGSWRCHQCWPFGALMGTFLQRGLGEQGSVIPKVEGDHHP